MMVFKATGNLGDTVQAVALARLLGPTFGWFRDQPELTLTEEGPGIASGFMLGAQKYSPEKTFFCGVWFPVHNEAYVPWIRRTPWPVGARDPVTNERFAAVGIRSQLVGCVSLTLPKYTGPRKGELSVDLADGPGAHWSHNVSPYLRLEEEWALAKDAIYRYAQASLVHTTRIHVALPCIALGTPVRYLGPRDDRTSIVDAVGIKHGKESLPDATYWRELFVDFLERHTGRRAGNGQYHEAPRPIVHENA